MHYNLTWALLECLSGFNLPAQTADVTLLPWPEISVCRALALALAAALATPSFGQNGPAATDIVPFPPIRPDVLTAPAVHAPDFECTARLAKLSVEIDSKHTPAQPKNPACVIAGPVVLLSVRNPADGKTVTFPDRPLLACRMAERLAQYTLDTLGPMARETLGRDITSIGTGPGYDCRPRNRQPGAKMSPHGQGLAVDIMTVEQTGKRRVTVSKIEGEDQTLFVKKLLETACATFNTVLGPAADSFHADNIHIDLEPRGLDGKVKLCR